MSNTEILPPEKFLPPETQEVHTDLDYAKKNLYDLIETGREGLYELAEVAKASQNARMYEVLAAYLKTISELNKDLIQLSMKKEEVTKPEEKHEPGVTNNLFVGTGAQLLELLKQVNKEKTSNTVIIDE